MIKGPITNTRVRVTAFVCDFDFQLKDTCRLRQAIGYPDGPKAPAHYYTLIQPYDNFGAATMPEVRHFLSTG